ncbi:MAG TPA: carbohydrate ABC transporter permease [Candidatus Tectomicrobia bacterium]|nr:carbohydrate ABC transporter permease [Candidatus Tectomicrobia bacterium]
MVLTKTGSQRMVKGIGNLVLAVMLLWTAIPFYWMVVTSLKHDKEIYGYEATLIPEKPTLANYVTILRDTPYMIFLRNSTVVAVGSTVISLIIACLGAYAIARLNFPGRALLARLLVCTYLVPASLLFIPLFAIMSALRLTDTLHGLTFAYLSGDVPFCTWLLMGYFKSVPTELEEAALVDGCNRVTALIRVVLPVSLPALVVVTFFCFTRAWNEFLYAYVFTSTNAARTITTGLVNFMSADVFFWGPLMASTILSALPPVLMFLVFQRWVVKGLTLGAVKG